jgi:hypothetical protein
MPWLEPATPEEMAVPGWAERRHAEWYRRRKEWIARMNAAGFAVKLPRLGKKSHPAPAVVDVEPDPG